MLPRTAATALLYFGTAVFPASLLVPDTLSRAQLASLGASEETITLLMGSAYTASVALPVASWLASFAAAVLAFIGGLQQAAAVQSGSASATPLVVLGIGAALVGWAVVASAQWRGGATSDELLTLCAAYSLQACVERAVKLPTSAAGVLMSDVRLPPMVVAAASLAAAAAWRAPAGVVPLERALAAALAPLGLAFVAASVRRATRPRTKFSVVGVGTTNKCKVAAVRQVLATTPAIARSLVACKVSTGVDEQPVGLDVTIAGAKNRAAAARELVRRSAPKRRRGSPPSLGLGMESGIFQVGGKWFDVCVASAFDGAEHHLGLSCAFEVPPAVARALFSKAGMDLSKASNDAGVSSDPKLGEHGGLIGCLSGMAITREEYTVQAVRTALFFAADANKAFY